MIRRSWGATALGSLLTFAALIVNVSLRHGPRVKLQSDGLKES